MEWTSRTALLIGEEKLEKLRKAHVLVAGLGGVGSTLAEMLCRAGIGKLTIVDADVIEASNINRQIVALHSCIGKEKAGVMAERLKDINPDVELAVMAGYLKGESITELLSVKYDYIADAIDTLTPKLQFINECMKGGHRLISSMGAAAKLDPSLVRIAPLESSHGCRLAFVVRKRLRRYGISTGFDVVFSPEAVPPGAMQAVEERNKKTRLGTISYMPPLFGCMMASAIIRNLVETDS